MERYNLSTPFLQAHFHDFLELKAQQGFSIADHLRQKYFSLQQSKTIREWVRNFTLLGIAGYFFSPSQKNISQWAAFTNEVTMYQACQKSCQLYKTYLAAPEQHQQAMLLALQQMHDMPDAYQPLVNQVLYALTKKFNPIQAEEAVFENFICRQLIKEGKLAVGRIQKMYASYEKIETLAQRIGLVSGVAESFDDQKDKIRQKIGIVYVRICNQVADGEKIHRQLSDYLLSKEIYGLQSSQEEKDELKKRAYLLDQLTQTYLLGKGIFLNGVI